jgi:hypothetical protein
MRGGQPGLEAASSQSSSGSARSLVVLVPIGVLCVLLYARVTASFFCSYDDFYEVHRAAFEDSRDPARILTTPHFGSQRYRPLNRAANDLTYWIGGPIAFPFRARNLFFHLVNVGLVYGLGVVLFSSRRVAGFGALLFAIHPMVNQTLVGAVVTNSMAYMFVLLACLLCAKAAQPPFRWLLMVLGLLLGWLGLLTYDPAVIVFPLIALWLGLRAWQVPQSVDRRRTLITFGAATALLGLVYLVLRLFFVPSGFSKAASNLPTAMRLAKDIGLYAVALVSPLDPVLAHALWGTPFPSDLPMQGPAVWIGAVVAGVLGLGLGALAYGWLRRRGQLLEGSDLAGLLFLLVGVALQLVPVLLFGNRPSETYLYFPVAFFSLAISFVAWHLYSAAGTVGKWTVIALLASLTSLSFAATWVRNESVARCGRTAARILAEVPCPVASGADSTVRLAPAPGSEASHRYGFYGFRGIDAIGDGKHAGPAVTAALQLFCSDLAVHGQVVGTDQLREGCVAVGAPAHASSGFFVSADGDVQPCASRP